MASNPKVFDPFPTPDEREEFDAVIARVLSGARERIQADIRRARELGIIDEHSNLLSKDLPAVMRSTRSAAGTPLNPDDYDWRF
jgi:hypothetical protein